MLLAFILLTASIVYMLLLMLIVVGFYKDPVLHHFERYAELDDSFNLVPAALLGFGLIAIFGGVLFTSAVAPAYPPVLLGALLIFLAWITNGHREWMNTYPSIFLSYPRWYVELRERTTREERRRIAYMWLCLPRRMRLHLNGSDYLFLIWADQVILATVTQTVEDQEAKVEGVNYIPDLHGRYG